MIGLALAAAAYDLPPALRARVLARIVGPVGEEARAGDAELVRGRGAKDTRVVRAAWAAAARVPVPPGLRTVHASWIEHALRDLPHAARTALAGGSTRHTRVATWLARWACARFPPLPTVAPDLARPIAAIDDVLAWPEAPLAAWLADVGADQLAFSTSAAGPAYAEAMARRFPAVAAALARIAVAPRAGQLGPARAAIERCKVAHDGPNVRGDAERPGGAIAAQIGARGDAERPGGAIALRIGARTIAPHLARAATPYAEAVLALRLPRPLGLEVLAELYAHAADPIDRGPAWAAIAA